MSGVVLIVVCCFVGSSVLFVVCCWSCFWLCGPWCMSVFSCCKLLFVVRGVLCVVVLLCGVCCYVIVARRLLLVVVGSLLVICCGLCVV